MEGCRRRTDVYDGMAWCGVRVCFIFGGSNKGNGKGKENGKGDVDIIDKIPRVEMEERRNKRRKKSDLDFLSTLRTVLR